MGPRKPNRRSKVNPSSRFNSFGLRSLISSNADSSTSAHHDSPSLPVQLGASCHHVPKPLRTDSTSPRVQSAPSNQGERDDDEPSKEAELDGVDDLHWAMAASECAPDVEMEICNDEDPELILEDGHGPCVQATDGEFVNADILIRNLKKVFTNGSMLGITSMYGKVRLSCDQYSFLTCALKNNGGNATLPSHSKLRQRLLPYLLSNCFVTSQLIDFPVTKDADSDPAAKKTKTAMVVLPSSWAALDVACVHVANDLFLRTTLLLVCTDMQC